MPCPLGRARIAGVREGKLLLSCAEPKGWCVRVPKAATSAEHPGTCVRWEEQLFEVEDLETHADGSLTYTLARWDERHAIRVIVTYDAETEAQRIKEPRTATRRVEGRTALLLAAPFVGCLPAPGQERFEHEYNVRASTMSLASALPLWILGWISLILLLASSVGGAGFLPTPVLVFGVYLLAESTARLAVRLQQGRASCGARARSFGRARGASREVPLPGGTPGALGGGRRPLSSSRAGPVVPGSERPGRAREAIRIRRPEVGADLGDFPARRARPVRGDRAPRVSPRP